MLAALRRGMYFETIKLTAEDSERNQSYKANLARQELEKNCTTVEDFLASLEMVAETGPVNSATITRVTQLINKTNQFNLTTRRYTEEQVRIMAESPNWWTRWFRLKDKFGDHGLVGVILAKKNGRIWHIDTWLMSCRVLGRKMEEFMSEILLKETFKEGTKEIHGEYIPGGKNTLVKDMYLNIGFAREKEPNHFIFRIVEHDIPHCVFISENLMSGT
jgi:FkbH-like protein